MKKKRKEEGEEEEEGGGGGGGQGAEEEKKEGMIKRPRLNFPIKTTRGLENFREGVEGEGGEGRGRKDLFQKDWWGVICKIRGGGVICNIREVGGYL